MLGIAAVAGVVFLGGGYVLFDKFVSPKLRVSASDLGLAGVVGDSPQAIVGDLIDVMKDLGNVASGIRDDASAQAALPRLVALEDRIFDIERRTILVEPITKEELKKIEARFEREGKALNESLKKDFENLPQLQGTEAAAVLRSIAFALQSAVGAVQNGMAKVPEPKNDLEKLAHEYVELDRELTRILARVDSESDISQAIADFEAIIPRFEDIASRKQEMGGPGMQMRFGMVDINVQKYRTSDALPKLFGRLEHKFGETDEVKKLGEAYLQASSSSTNYQFALMAGANGGSSGRGSAAEGTASGHQPAGPSQGHGAGGASGGPQPFAGRPGMSGPGGFRPPSLPAGESVRVILKGGPFESATPLQGQPDAFFAAKKRQTEAQKSFSAQLTKLAESNRSHSTITGGTSTTELSYTGDVQQLADKIDFGTVTNVDAESRTITVDMSDVVFEVEEEEDPAEEPSASSSGGFDV